jgi:glycosyltransferase involved in cell wall biosynthesis
VARLVAPRSAPSSGERSALRIAAIHLGFFYAGGGERLILDQVLGLRRLGHEVELFAPIVDREACYPELIDQVGVHSLVPRLPGWLPGRVALSVLAASLLAPLLVLRLRHFDVILAANQPSLWIAWVARKVLGIPYVGYLAQPNRVLYPRAVDQAVKRPNLDYRLFSLLAHALRPLVGWTDRVSVSGATELLANGTYMASVLQRIYGRVAEPCPAGTDAAGLSGPSIDRHRGELRLGEQAIPKPYVLLTNRHFEVKRFDYAIRAMTLAPKAHLVVTGAFTPYTDEMRRLAQRVGVAERTIFTGLVSEAVLRRLYAEAAVYIYPAPEEDYGMGIVEAMGHAVPVVAWNAAGPTSIVEPEVTGVLVKPFDELGFAQAVSDLLDDPDRAAQMGHAGWLRVADGLGSESHCRHLAAVLGRTAAPARRTELVSQPVRRN